MCNYSLLCERTHFTTPIAQIRWYTQQMQITHCCFINNFITVLMKCELFHASSLSVWSVWHTHWILTNNFIKLVVKHLLRLPPNLCYYSRKEHGRSLERFYDPLLFHSETERPYLENLVHGGCLCTAIIMKSFPVKFHHPTTLITWTCL